jgi:hypothetical protein
VYTPEDYARKAAALWQRFTTNERALVGIGIFPSGAMDVAEAAGYETQPLAVALMNEHRTATKGRGDAGS